ncbi:hypothetical protein M011DRAFT_501893 [Sporormia fimetaria CBS 119925]|uniref:Uncharacterized protein n=1 Tax=Sporormia fimetaria CBS 119925 TaxID=1340428 RepID=A0A6A6VC09_9PLEO|nr:hypothetical protein M011DRAFT_501893 [Sporormia fimetaria CBS 119925]
MNFSTLQSHLYTRQTPPQSIPSTMSTKAQPRRSQRIAALNGTKPSLSDTPKNAEAAKNKSVFPNRVEPAKASKACSTSKTKPKALKRSTPKKQPQTFNTTNKLPKASTPTSHQPIQTHSNNLTFLPPISPISIPSTPDTPTDQTLTPYPPSSTPDTPNNDTDWTSLLDYLSADDTDAVAETLQMFRSRHLSIDSRFAPGNEDYELDGFAVDDDVEEEADDECDSVFVLPARKRRGCEDGGSGESGSGGRLRVPVWGSDGEDGEDSDDGDDCEDTVPVVQPAISKLAIRQAKRRCVMDTDSSCSDSEDSEDVLPARETTRLRKKSGVERFKRVIVNDTTDTEFVKTPVQLVSTAKRNVRRGPFLWSSDEDSGVDMKAPMKAVERRRKA